MPSSDVKYIGLDVHKGSIAVLKAGRVAATLYGGVPMENKRAANSAAVREILIRKSSR